MAPPQIHQRDLLLLLILSRKCLLQVQSENTAADKKSIDHMIHRIYGGTKETEKKRERELKEEKDA